ncbi:MAG: Trk family potassium uptake protein [Clostridia bacterium]|jgi:trk system potassium uptake protein TrkH|nr:Trk family potassium uptake protein [Clostridia bacterium]
MFLRITEVFNINTLNELSRKFNISPTRAVVMSFAIIILAGTILLNLPIASKNGESIGFINALFTATSATCVTGLVVVDTGTHWTAFGKVVIITLIQIGGLGIMTFSTMLALLVGRRITLKERMLLQESYNQFDLEGMVRLTKNIIIATFAMELTGALIFSSVFIPQFGWGRGLAYGLWHGISSFCNAGFDLMGEHSGPFSSFTSYVNNPIININAMMLVVIGGLGFSVWIDCYHAFKKRNVHELSLHSKVVLSTTAGLILLGTVFIFLMEVNNSATIGNLPWSGKILASFFQSITPRTVGFNTLDLPSLSLPTKFMTIILMFIGGAPGSTAGGIKITTAGILFFTVFSVVRGRESTELFKRRLPKYLVYRAISVVLISFLLVVVATMVLSIAETPYNNSDFMTLLFEATSAFGTVGLTMNYTPSLTSAGRVIIILCMFAGRVGPLSLVLALAQSANKNRGHIKYPEDRIIVG